MPAFNKEEMKKKPFFLFDLPLVCECRYPSKVFHDHKHKGNGRMPVWETGDPHSLLGLLPLGSEKGMVGRCLSPDADQVELVDLRTNESHPMERLDAKGFFELHLPLENGPFPLSLAFPQGERAMGMGGSVPLFSRGRKQGAQGVQRWIGPQALSQARFASTNHRRGRWRFLRRMDSIREERSPDR